MKKTIEIPRTSLLPIIKGLERYGNNYRYKWDGEFYKVKDAKPGANGVTVLYVESVL